MILVLTISDIWQSRVEIKYYSVAYTLQRSKRSSAELLLRAGLIRTM